MAEIIPVKNLTAEESLYGDRTTRYRWEVLEHSNGVDQLVGILDGVSDGSLSWQNNAAVKGRGKLEVVDLDVAEPGMLRIGDLPLESCRLRPVMTINENDRAGSYQEVWTETDRNLYPNPSFESNFPPAIAVAGLSGAITTSRPAGGAYVGTNFARITWTTGTTATTNSGWNLGTFPATAGLPYSASMAVRSSRAGQGISLYIQFLNSVGTNIGNNLLGVVTATNTWAKVDVLNRVAPVGTTQVRLLAYQTGGAFWQVGDTMDVDAIVLRQGTTIPQYVDGNLTSPVPYRRFRFVGTANLSDSVAETRTLEYVPGTEPLLPEMPWGTFLVSSASEEWEDTGRVWSLSLLDRCTVPSQDAVDQSYAVAAGTLILQEVRSILASAGEYMAINESSTLATSSGMVWEAGTSKLKIINDLLDVAGYNALWMDGWGNFQATPRVLPANRSIIYELLGFPRELRDGEQSIYRPDWTRDRDSFDVPNKVIAVQAANGDDATALVGQWTNEDPASPYSYVSRGNRWIPYVLDGVECPEGTDAEIIAFLQARARATLVQMSAVQATVKVEHLPIPVRVSDVLQFAHTKAGIDARHVITSLELDTSPTGLMRSTLQEVISL